MTVSPAAVDTVLGPRGHRVVSTEARDGRWESPHGVRVGVSVPRWVRRLGAKFHTCRGTSSLFTSVRALLVGGQCVLDLAHEVLRALGVGSLRVAGFGRALAAVVGDELLGVRRGQDALVVGERLQRLDPERLTVDLALAGGPQTLACAASRRRGVEDV